MLCLDLRRRNGLSLVEVMVAILLTATVALLGVGVSHGASATSARATSERERNSERFVNMFLLRDVLLHAAAPTVGLSAGRDSERLHGTENHLVFDSLCQSATNSREWCTVDLSIRHGTPVMRLSNSDSEYIVETRDAVNFRYRIEMTDSGAVQWLKDWAASVKHPSGIALVGLRDTIVFRLGSVE